MLAYFAASVTVAGCYVILYCITGHYDNIRNSNRFDYHAANWRRNAKQPGDVLPKHLPG